MTERTDASVPKWPDNRPPLTLEEGFKEYREKINFVIKRLEGRIKTLEEGAVLEVKEDMSGEKLDRIIELLERLQPQESNWQQKNLQIDGKWYTFNWNSNDPTQCYYEVLVTCP